MGRYADEAEAVIADIANVIPHAKIPVEIAEFRIAVIGIRLQEKILQELERQRVQRKGQPQ